MALPKVQIGVFGGSGFYSLLSKSREYEIKTPYGRPSDKVFVGDFEGKTVAFLPRHGKHHHLPPHKVPYRANLYAFKMLSVNTILAPVSAGSLQAKIKPGDFVLCDQFVNQTQGRDDTFFEGGKTKNKFSKGKVVHISAADPYCFDLRVLAQKTAEDLKMKVHPKGTVVVINGPRFASKSESEYFQRQNWEVINMTQYPECILARELEICYLGMALITDYDAGLIGQKGRKPVTAEAVLKVFKNNNERVKKLIFEILRRLPDTRVCGCHNALKDAVM